jgi:zinc transport system substrate-binding protein
MGSARNARKKKKSMKNKNKYFNANKYLLLLIIIPLILTACQAAEKTEGEETHLVVTVSILPQAYFVERIAGDAVMVNVMVGPGEEAHTYEPSPEQMKTLSSSQIFFSIGVEYEESWIPRFKDINPELTVIDSAAGIKRIPMTDDHIHKEEPEEHNEEERMDPHVWLSPQNGKLIAQNMLTALVELAPEQAETFEENYDALMADIDALDARIQAILSNSEGRAFMVFHPAWGYFAHDYNLEQIAVQVSGQDPSVSELADLVDKALEENIRVVFIQPSFSSTDAQAIAEEINGEVAVVDPLARDWLTNLENVAEAFAAALNQ